MVDSYTCNRTCNLLIHAADLFRISNGVDGSRREEKAHATHVLRPPDLRAREDVRADEISGWSGARATRVRTGDDRESSQGSVWMTFHKYKCTCILQYLTSSSAVPRIHVSGLVSKPTHEMAEEARCGNGDCQAETGRTDRLRFRRLRQQHGRRRLPLDKHLLSITCRPGRNRGNAHVTSLEGLPVKLLELRESGVWRH